MKIAFLSANREQLPDPVVPLGILHVMAATPAPHARELWDMCFSRAPLISLRQKIAGFTPDLVAMGLRNLYNSDYSGTQHNVAYYKSLIETIRADAPDAKIVLGGGGFSVIPEKLMAHLKPDFGIAGEGEESFPMLLAELEKPEPDFARVPGLFYFREGQPRANSVRAAFLDLNKRPPLPRHLVDKNYYRKVGIENVQTKRGCVLKCSYCTYPKIEGRNYRTRTPANVVDDLFRSLEANPEINHFFIVDSVFNLPRQHAKDVCKEMIARGFDTPWTCYVNPLGFDPELADLMARARCQGMEIGSDSGCDEVLKGLRKGFTTKDIRNINRLSKAAGLKDCHTFILGTPGESMEQVKRSMDFIIDLDPYAAIVMAWTDDEDVLDSPNAFERRRLREQILDSLRAIRSDFPRWVIPPLGENFDHRMFRFLRLQGCQGPLWQNLRAPTAGGSAMGQIDLPIHHALENFK